MTVRKHIDTDRDMKTEGPTRLLFATKLFAVCVVLLNLFESSVENVIGRETCYLTGQNIFETTGNSHVGLYPKFDNGKKNICANLKDLTPLGNSSLQSCCSREELDSLETRWRTTKWIIYRNRTMAWARIIRRLTEGEKAYRTHIEQLSKLKAVKLDCVAASNEVKNYLEKGNPAGKPEMSAIWSSWRTAAMKCFNFTIRIKIGLFCSICSPNAYKNIIPADQNIKDINIPRSHCDTFLSACSDYINQQQIVKEFVSAVAALSKCDEKGWTPFEQEYIYKSKDTKITGLIDWYRKLSSNITNNEEICKREYSLSTMITSDLGKREYWLEFAKNAESVFTKYKFNMSQTIEYLYQADDEHSTKQDLPDFRINVGSGTSHFLDYYNASNFEPEINQALLEELTASSNLMFFSLIGLCFAHLLHI